MLKQDHPENVHFSSFRFELFWSGESGNPTTATIIEYPMLEGILKDHQVQPLSPHMATQKSDHLSENTVQMLLELQLCAVTTAPESLFQYLTTLW